MLTIILTVHMVQEGFELISMSELGLTFTKIFSLWK